VRRCTGLWAQTSPMNVWVGSLVSEQSLYHIIDTFIAKKKLKDNLSTVLQEA
jgi:hypothetical protein